MQILIFFKWPTCSSSYIWPLSTFFLCYFLHYVVALSHDGLILILFISLHSLSSVPLRVAPVCPALLRPLSAGFAGRRSDGDGGRGRLYSLGVGFLTVSLGLGFVVWSHVAYGEMPLGSSSLVLLPSTG